VRSVICTVLILFPCHALAVTGYMRPAGGLMMQPASQYHHAVYGLAMDISNEAQSLVGRVSYVERPKFIVNGFEDQDAGSFALIGTKVTKAKGHGLMAFIGGGQMRGYIKETSDPASSRTYKLPGLCAAVEYAGSWRALSASIGHQTFIGVGTKDQREAYVAWPFNFLLATIGVRI